MESHIIGCDKLFRNSVFRILQTPMVQLFLALMYLCLVVLYYEHAGCDNIQVAEKIINYLSILGLAFFNSQFLKIII